MTIMVLLLWNTSSYNAVIIRVLFSTNISYSQTDRYYRWRDFISGFLIYLYLFIDNPFIIFLTLPMILFWDNNSFKAAIIKDEI